MSSGCRHEWSGSRPPPRPTLKRRADGTKGAAAPSRWGMRMLRASPASAGRRARSADVHVRAGVARPDGRACCGTSPAPRPTLKRRADGTKGAAAPARWGMRMLRPSPASAGRRARSAGVHVRGGVARPDACACGGTSPAPAGRRARSAGVHVRADAASWSRSVAECSATDATLWLLTHHNCTLSSING